MNTLRYEQPTRLDQIQELLRDLDKRGKEYVLYSGGTDLIPMLKLQDMAPAVLISLNGLTEFSKIQCTPGSSISIGSQVTLASLISDPSIQKYAPGLAQAARLIASPQLRNRATVGGNLLVNNRCTYYNQSAQLQTAHGACFKAGSDVCHLIPSAARGKMPLCRARFVSDLAPVLLVLDATLHLFGTAGKRSLPLREFYTPDGIERNKLGKGEILARIEVRLPTLSYGPIYEKLRVRNAIDFPSLGVAAGIEQAAGGLGRKLQLALTGVQTHPICLSYQENDFPVWSGSEKGLIETAIREATSTADVLKQDFFPPRYRRHMIGVFIQRAAQKLLALDTSR